MNIVILGAGDTGRYLANHLSNKNHSIKLIDKSESVVGSLNDVLDVGTICGDGAQASVLGDGGVATADLFIALTDNQHVNLLAASIAKAMGSRKTIARVDVPIQADKKTFDYQRHFSIDYVFSSEQLVAFEISKYFLNPEASTSEQIGRGRIKVQQVEVSLECKLLKKPIQSLMLPQLVRVAVIHRGNSVIIPQGQDVLEPNDRVILFGEQTFVEELAEMLRADNYLNESRKITIYGGSEYGMTLAMLLKNTPNKVRIIEEDAKVCTWLSTQLPQAVIVHGDGRSVELLKEEQIEKADFFIGMSNHDENNLMACLQAKTLGVKYVIPLVHNADNSSVVAQHLEPFGFLATVSPRQVNLMDLVRFVDSHDFYSVGYLSDEVELVQFTVSEGARVAGKLVKEVKWPENSSLVTLLRNDRVIIPGGKDHIKAGDSLYSVVLPNSRKSLLKVLTR